MVIRQSYLVEGMTCSGCERAVQKSVSMLDGIEEARADLASATLSVAYHSDKLNIEQIKAAVNKLGYKIVGERAPAGRKEGRDDAVS